MVRTTNAGALLALVTLSGNLTASDRVSPLPPWVASGDLPLPTWAKSARVLAPKDPAALQVGPPLFRAPGRSSERRGTAIAGALLPVYGAKRGSDCSARWLLVGPSSWICADVVEWSRERPIDPLGITTAGGELPYRYFFVGREGAQGYETPELSEDGAPLQEYDPGFGVAAAEEVGGLGRSWVRTPTGRYIDRASLSLARTSQFRGAVIRGPLEIAWTNPERAVVSLSKPRKTFGRRQPVTIFERRQVGKEDHVRVSRAEEAPIWLHAKDVVEPALAPVPEGVRPGEKWIDVDLRRQCLVAYEGERPAYATLVSSGRGPEGSDTATPKGSFRIWVKLTSSNMDNLEDDEADQHYSLEDVPYVQFFNKAVALHGVFWHDDFGKKRSHGCVNLAPIDAAWLFRWTTPHLPAGWSAVLPTDFENGTLVRVH